MSDVITELSIDEIYLDEKNPRLPENVSRSQQDMLVYIARNTSITELMSAIAENDYFPGEPIVVIPRESGGYWAVEGNRRLTALKLLQDPSLHHKNAKVLEISETAKHKPTSVPCVEFAQREQVTNYLGYRHISGVKQWEPIAKARYIALYFDTRTASDTTPSERYREVARGVGSQAPFVKRQLDGLALFRHAESKEFYYIDDLDEETVSFSLITTAIGYEDILDFVSCTRDPYIDGELHEDNVKSLFEWLFKKNAKGETVLGESRNIQRLAAVVSDENALAVLYEDKSIDMAFQKTKGISIEYNDLLVAIEHQLIDAVGRLALVDLNEGHIDRIETIFKQARALKRLSEDN